MSQSEETKSPFQQNMAEIRSMVKDCWDKEEAAYMYRNMIQVCMEISRQHGFTLETSDVRRAKSPVLKESRRKVVRVS